MSFGVPFLFVGIKSLAHALPTRWTQTDFDEARLFELMPEEIDQRVARALERPRSDELALWRATTWPATSTRRRCAGF